MAKIIGKTDDGKDIYGLNFDMSVKQVDQSEAGGRIFSMIGSTPSVDRDGDTIDQKGWVTKYYKKSPVVQWAHDHKIPAIAKVNKFSIDGASLSFDNIEFPEPGIHPFADMISSLMEGGFIKAGSVGFIPIKAERRELTDKEKENEPDHFCPPMNFKKQELMEFSICNVGSNRDALVTHLGNKGFETSGKVKIEGHEFELKQLIDALFIKDEEVVGGITIDSGAFGEGVFGDDGRPEAVIPIEEGKSVLSEKRVIPFKHYALDPEDASWSGPTERAGAEIADLKVISTWVDVERNDVKGGYKLPHHRAGNHNTVWTGVRAAMASLLGARGGVDIPSSERLGVYNHLKSHYSEFDKPVPEFKEYVELEMKALFPYETESICPYCATKFDERDNRACFVDTYSDPVHEHCVVIRGKEVSPKAKLRAIKNAEESTHFEGVIFGDWEADDEVKSKYVEIYRDAESGILSLSRGDSYKELSGKEVRISWKSEATNRCFEANLEVYDQSEDKWADLEVIKIQEKAGAVLSKSNKNKLSQAKELIGEVLAASEPVEAATETEPPNNPQPPGKYIKEILDRMAGLESKVEAMADNDKTIVVNNIHEPMAKEDIEVEIEEEKQLDIDEVEVIQDEQISLEDVIKVIGDAIKPMAQEVIKTEIRKVTGKID